MVRLLPPSQPRLCVILSGVPWNGGRRETRPRGHPDPSRGGFRALRKVSVSIEVYDSRKESSLEQ